MSSNKYSATSFLEACGAAGPLRLSVSDGSRPEPLVRDFHQPFIVVGRDPSIDLTLDNWRVSRRHSYLQLVAGRVFCMDLGSRTGTQWDVGSNRSGWLDFDRSIRVGPYEIRRDPRDADLDADQDAEDSRTGTTISVEFLSRADRPSRLRIENDLSIVGSSPECRVHLPFSDVSKAHCSLVRGRGGLWVVDLFGRGGIQVNDRPVRFAKVDHGDELRIGRQVLRFHEEQAGPAPEPGRAVATRPPRDRGGLAIPEPVPLLATAWEYPEDEAARLLAERPSSQTELVQALMQPMVQQFGLMQQQMFEQFHQAMMGMFQSFGAFYREQTAELREELAEVRRLTRELQELQAQAAAREATTTTPAPYPRPATDRETPPRKAPIPVAAPEPEPEATIRKPPTKTDPGVHGALFQRISQLQTERQTRWQKVLAMMNRTPG